MKKFLLIVMSLLVLNQAKSQQKVPEGIIVYTVSWELPEQAQAMAGSLPSEIEVYFKGDSSSMKIESQYFSTQSILNTKKEYERLLLEIPIMSKKYSVLFTPADQEMLADKYPQFTYKPSTENKIIQGFKTLKFEILESKSDKTFEVWFTKDVEIVSNPLSRFYESSYGFPVEFTTYQNGLTVRAVVKEIKKMAVPAGVFSASSDYEEMTLTQLMQMRGGQ